MEPVISKSQLENAFIIYYQEVIDDPEKFSDKEDPKESAKSATDYIFEILSRG